GPPLRDDPLGLAATALSLVVAALGPVALLLPAVLGARRRGLPFGLQDLAGLLACQGLACWAAWRAAAELAVAPYRWAKTEHGLTARGAGVTAGARAPLPDRPPDASG
ncbi:MAG: glycosyl transferase, partial [Alsobacter sp.]